MAVYPVLVAVSKKFFMSNETGARPRRHNWFYRRIALPLMELLRMGSTPQKLAWSIAVGIAIGINPLLGTTTFLCLAVALVFRLNLVASQIGNHIVYPLELLLVVPFLRLGASVFHAAPLPLRRREILLEVRSNPLALAHRLWLWELHGLVVWAVVAVILAPVCALLLTPLLRRLHAHVERQRHAVVAEE